MDIKGKCVVSEGNRWHTTISTGKAGPCTHAKGNTFFFLTNYWLHKSTPSVTFDRKCWSHFDDSGILCGSCCHMRHSSVCLFASSSSNSHGRWNRPASKEAEPRGKGGASTPERLAADEAAAVKQLEAVAVGDDGGASSAPPAANGQAKEQGGARDKPRW